MRCGQRTLSLDAADWQPLGDVVTGTGGVVQVTDPTAGVTDSGYYRVRLVE